jgi:hypothetical protein
MLTMRPKRRAFMPGTTALIRWNADDRLMATIASHFRLRELLDRRDVLDAGVVDDDVDLAELGLGLAAPCAGSAPGWLMSAAE